MAEVNRKWSPYVYALNNPIRFIDPDGMYSTEEWKRDNGITDEDVTTIYKAPDSQGNMTEGSNQANGEENKTKDGGPKKRNTSDKTQNTKSGGSWFTQDDIPVWCWARKASNDWENGDYAYSVGDVLMGVVDLALIWVPGDIAGRGTAKTGVPVIGPRTTYRQFAEEIEANYIKVTDESWTWAKIQKFLEDVVKRGDDVIFAGKFNPTLLDKTSVLAREIKYLEKNGYQWTSNFSRMSLKK